MEEENTGDNNVGERDSRSNDVSGFVEYGIDDKPPILQSVFLGFQHYLTMIGATVAIPLVLSGAMDMPKTQTGVLIGTFFVAWVSPPSHRQLSGTGTR